MKDRLEDLLRFLRYKKLYTEQEEVRVYFLDEAGCVTVCVLIEADTEFPDWKEKCEKILWRFRDSGCQEVHMLKLLFTEDPDSALLSAGEDRFCWVIDNKSRRLLLSPNAVENFYGLKERIEGALAAEHYESRYLEEPLEYEPGGKLCYRHIGQRPVVNHALLILNLMGYILCILFPTAIYQWGELSWSKVFAGDWYRMFSHMFLHADPAHLTGNALMLLLIGDITERAVGHLKYAVLYMAGGLFAACVSMQVSYLKGDMVGSIGASGAIFAIVGLLLWVVIRNNGKLEMLTTKKLIFLIAYTLYFGFTSTRVDNAAHIGGLIGGILGGILFYRKKKRSDSHKGKGEKA